MNTLKNINIKKINKIILTDYYNSIIFKNKENVNVYIVGGYLRDTILCRKIYDRDYVIEGDFEKFLKIISKKISGKLIQIGKTNLNRIILNNGQILDFMPLCTTIEKDISKRDFTINSLAWSPKTGIIDLYNGIIDLKQKKIRMIGIENLKNDPLRIIRAYRMSEELSFSIEKNTRKAIKTICSMIKNISIERITLDFFRILNTNNPENTLRMLLKDGVLQKIISLSYSKLDKRLNVINQVNSKLNKLHLKQRIKFKSLFSQNLTYSGLIILELLLYGMPENRLRFSSTIQKRLLNIKKTTDLLKTYRNDLNKSILFDIFRNAGDAAEDFLIINNFYKYKNDLKRYHAILKKEILSANEIIKITKILKDKILGQKILELKKAQFENKIKTKRDAKEFLFRN